MPAFISTFSLGLLLLSSLAYAAPGEDRTSKPEEDDFSQTPFTEYGEFNEDLDEAADTKFFQYGRFFGVSVGLGFQGVTGNRGILYQGGFPLFDLKLHYWFDFNFALDLNLTTVAHYYDSTSGNTTTHTDVNMTRLGVDLRYYFDTKNLSAAISFANPFVLVGVGSMSKTEVDETGTTTPDSAFTLTAGGGLEFAISPKKAYFQVESKIHLARFKDTYSRQFASSNPPISDLTGLFYTVSGSILFTW